MERYKGLRGKFTYIPAAVNKYQKRDGWEHSLNWWEKDDYFQYPYLLCSAFYMKEHMDFRKYWTYPEDYFLMGDSGGFQIASKGVWIRPESVMQWHQQNVDIGLLLDSPFKKSSLHLHRRIDKEMDECLADSISMSNKMLGMRRPDERCKIYNILHGETFDDMERWYKGIKKCKGEWDGWALSTASGGDLSISVRNLIFGVEFFDTDLHLLGIAGYSNMPLATYMARKTNRWITSDSATYALGGESRTYHLSTGFLVELGTKEGSDLNELPCHCPICSVNSVEDMRGINDVEGSAISGRLLSLHNLWCMIDYNNKLNALSGNYEVFKRFVDRFMPSKHISSYLEIIDQYLENGYDWIKKRETALKRLDKEQSTILEWDDNIDAMTELQEMFGENVNPIDTLESGTENKEWRF